jgi:hypothetical protein
MNGQTITIASGIILLIVFALVGWNLRRKSARADQDRSKEGLDHDRR